MNHPSTDLSSSPTRTFAARAAGLIGAALALLLVPTASLAESPSTRERVVDRLLDSAGIDILVRNQAQGAVQGFVQTVPGINSTQLAEIERIADKHFGPQVLRSAIEKRFDEHLTVDHARNVIDWLRSPIGRKTTALERSVDAPEKAAALYASVEGFDPRSMNAHRRQLLTRFDRAQKLSEFAADAATQPALAAFVGAARASGNDDDDAAASFRAQIHSKRKQALHEFRRLNLAIHSKIFESLSNDELSQYIAFAETPSGQWYSDALRRSVMDSMIHASRGFGSDLGEMAAREAGVPARVQYD